MKKSAWRDVIDEKVKQRMEHEGFTLDGYDFDFWRVLSDEADIVIKIKQGFRSRPHDTTELFGGLRVVNKEIAELFEVCTTFPRPRTPPPHWSHRSETRRAAFISLNPPGKYDWHLSVTSNLNDVQKVIDSIVERINGPGLAFASEFKTFDQILKRLESANPQTGSGCDFENKCCAFVLANRLAEAESLVDQQYKEFIATDKLKYQSLFVDFRKGLKREIKRLRLSNQ